MTIGKHDIEWNRKEEGMEKKEEVQMKGEKKKRRKERECKCIVNVYSKEEEKQTYTLIVKVGYTFILT